MKSPSLLAFVLLGIFFSSNPSQAQERSLKFDGGIGYYLAIDGKLNYIYWPTPKISWAETNSIWRIPTNAQFYVFGLDFSGPPSGGTSFLGKSVSGAGHPAPPHWRGYTFTYADGDGNLQSPWPARFIPLSGYKEKVYEIVFDGPQKELKSGELYHRYCVFQLGNSTDAGEAFVFSYTQPEKKPVTGDGKEKPKATD